MALHSDLNAHKRICTCTYNREDGELSVKRSHTFLIGITAFPEKAMVKLKGRGCEVERKKREVPSGEVIKKMGGVRKIESIESWLQFKGGGSFAS